MNDKKTEITVLLIENNAGNARLIESLLQDSQGYDIEISWASRMDDGLRLAKNKKFDLVLLDVDSKYLSDTETLSYFHTHYPNYPIVALVSTINANKICKYIANGATDILIKNRVTSADLLKSIFTTVLQSNKCKGGVLLLRGMSHYFKTHLTNIKASVDMISRETFGSVNEKQAELCSLASKNIQKLNALTDDIVEYSQLSNGEYNLRKKRDDIIQTIKEAITIVKRDAEKKGLRIYFEPSVDVPEIEYDHDSIQKVILSALINAIKFSDQGDIVVECFKKDHMVCTTIKDQGIGIPQQYIKDLFQPFFLVPLNEDYRKSQGTGLGLPISKKIAAIHGGDLKIESKKGHGTTVELQLPIEKTFAIK